VTGHWSQKAVAPSHPTLLKANPACHLTVGKHQRKEVKGFLDSQSRKPRHLPIFTSALPRPSLQRQQARPIVSKEKGFESIANDF
jgi:hypothetical protein